MDRGVAGRLHHVGSTVRVLPAVICSIGLASPALAQPPRDTPEDAADDDLDEPPDTLEFQPWRDGIITGLGVTFWILEETAFKEALAPDHCRWCERRGEGDDPLNGIDSSVRGALVWDSVNRADDLSNVTAYVIGPAVAFGGGALAAGRQGRLHEWRENSLVIAEAMTIAVSVNKLTKFAFARRRPYKHFATDQTAPDDPDEDVSFTSGHTALAFSLAVSGGTVASIRGYKSAPWVWGIGLASAAATGYLRMAADQHYLTDVLGGAITGGAIGFAVPWFLGRKDLATSEGPPVTPTVQVLDDGGAILGFHMVR